MTEESLLRMTPQTCKMWVLFYAVAIPIHAGLVVSVMMFELFLPFLSIGIASICGLFAAPFITTLRLKSLAIWTMKMLTVYILVVGGAISATLASIGGEGHVFTMWLATCTLLSLVLLQFGRWKGDAARAIVGSVGGLLGVMWIICFGMFLSQPVNQFVVGTRAFYPHTINERTLNESYRNPVATSDCWPRYCKNLVWPQTYQAFNKRPLPDGFTVSTDPYGVGAGINYDGNGSLDHSLCRSYEVFMRCGPIYTASIGSIWIGASCPYENRFSSNPLDPGCQSRDFVALNYVMSLGVGVFFAFAVLLWKLSLPISQAIEDAEEA